MRWRISADLLLQSLPNPKSTSQIHQQLLVQGILSPFSATKLLQFYAAAGDQYSAHKLFDQLSQPPNIFAWTALFSLQSSKHYCLQLYTQMRRFGVSPDAYALPPVLRSASSATTATALHAEVIKYAAGEALAVVNALIVAYARLHDPLSSCKVFDESPQRDVVSYNSLISAYMATGLLDPAMDLIRSMQSDGCDPDTVTWNIVLDGYRRAERCDEALRIFNSKVTHPNVVTFTTLIVGFARSGNHESAMRLFRRMIVEYGVPPDKDTLSTVISSCRQLKALQQARELHAYGIKNIVPISTFYSSGGAALVVMYASCGRITPSKHVFCYMDQKDVITWNALILAFTKAGMDTVALDYFNTMVSQGVRADEITLATVLPACDIETGKQIHAHVLRCSYSTSTAISNALINMYAEAGCIRIANNVFISMNESDVISWNTMIGGYGSNGLGKFAVELFYQMRHAGVTPNSVTFTSALAACSHSRLVDEGVKIFRLMSETFDVVPTMEQYASVVDLLARAGRFNDAVEFVKRIPLRPEGCVWGAILAACRAHQEVEFGRMAFDELVELEPENAGNYVTMSNIYVKAGRWEEAKAVRKIMESRGLVKPSGYSRMEA